MNYALHPHLLKQIEKHGIDYLMIAAAIEFGEILRAPGSVYYFLGKKGLKRLMKIFTPNNPEKWEGVTVVYDTARDCFITGYKNKNWPKKIRNRK